MRRYLIHRYGGPELLSLEESVEPEPGPGQVRVATRAIGINFADLIQRVGHYPRQPAMPFTPGMEAAGVIDAVGDGVSSEMLGMRVMAVPIYGSHAEKFCLGADYVMELPDWASFADGAGFPVMFLTAWYALHELGRARPGERAVVTAAAGGVGTAILQMARAAEVRVLAVVGSPSKHALARDLGAEAIYGYDHLGRNVADTFGEVDIVLDSVGGTLFRPLWRHLAISGRYVLFGFAQAGSPGGVSYVKAARGLLAMGMVSPSSLVTSNRTLAGFNLSVVPDQVPLLRKSATGLIDDWQSGKLRPILGEHFPFDRLPDAHRHLASRASTGRVIVEV